ncbi:MAG TPA: serine hydrolase domain-containing protein [Gaiellales bacterium]|jgi:CubicO group peptidase (beta-lactamase class C family)|nr:serine hydrolase domain-containing protein [Gaiellales bacterium]
MADVRFQGVREAAERHVGDDAVPGLVLLVAHGEDVQVEAIGRLWVGGPAVESDSLFRISSTSKPITGAATMALVDDGLLDLDEPVDRLLPELADRRVLRRMDGPLAETVPAERAITVRDLLTFTFGFGMVMEMFTAAEPWPVVAAAAELNTIGPPDPDIPPEPDRWIATLGSLPLLAQPGRRWLYNTGAAVLGVLLARAAGESFPDVLRHRVTEPLGMDDTGFWTDQPERLATGYQPTPEGLVVWDEPGGKWSRRPAFPDGAAGMLSTAADLLAFARMFLAGGAPVLGEESTRAMTTDQLTAEQKSGGGLGPEFFAGRSWSFCQAVDDSGAFGWDGGLGTSWLVDPVRDLVVIVLTQRLFETPGTPALHREVQAAAYAATG